MFENLSQLDPTLTAVFGVFVFMLGHVIGIIMGRWGRKDLERDRDGWRDTANIKGQVADAAVNRVKTASRDLAKISELAEDRRKSLNERNESAARTLLAVNDELTQEKRKYSECMSDLTSVKEELAKLVASQSLGNLAKATGGVTFPIIKPKKKTKKRTI